MEPTAVWDVRHRRLLCLGGLAPPASLFGDVGVLGCRARGARETDSASVILTKHGGYEQMDQLINQIVQRTGISQDQAQKAVEVVLIFA
jgi:hypothetical protein